MSVEIALSALVEHPMNSNVMAAEQFAKLRRHIQRSGRYEPLAVRPLPPEPHEAPPGGDALGPSGRFQVLNGHHRLKALRELGHPAARCDIWEVDEEEGLVLLATLNRLQGRDDPMRRAALLARLAGQADASRLKELSRLVPEDRAALQRAVELATRPLPSPAAPGDVAEPLHPMTFFLEAEDWRTVRRALTLAGKEHADDAPPRGRGAAAAVLVRMAQRYLADEPARP